MEAERLTVIFHVNGQSSPVEATGHKGELLTQVAYRAGVPIVQTCGGSPSCTDCKVKVLTENQEGAFEGMEGAEQRLLGNVYFLTKERLACQAILKGSCTVQVINNYKTKSPKSF